MKFTDKQINLMRSMIMPSFYNQDQAQEIAVNTDNPFVKEYMLIKLNNHNLIMAGLLSTNIQLERQTQLIIYGYAFEMLRTKKKKKKKKKGFLAKISAIVSNIFDNEGRNGHN